MRHAIAHAKICLIAAPGAGKGTICRRLLKKFPNFQIAGSGDILRKNISQGTALGQLAEKMVSKGKFVEDTIMIDIMAQEMKRQGLLNTCFVLDGYPRTVNQAKALDDLLDKHCGPLDLVVNLEVPQHEILRRIIERYIHLPSGRVYNLSYNPPRVFGRDDITGELLSKRADDNADTYRDRLLLYEQRTKSLLQHYGQRGILWTLSGDTTDQIWIQLEKLMTKRFKTADKVDFITKSQDALPGNRQKTVDINIGTESN